MGMFYMLRVLFVDGVAVGGSSSCWINTEGEKPKKLLQIESSEILFRSIDYLFIINIQFMLHIYAIIYVLLVMRDVSSLNENVRCVANIPTYECEGGMRLFASSVSEWLGIGVENHRDRMIGGAYEWRHITMDTANLHGSQMPNLLELHTLSLHSSPERSSM